MEILNSPGQHVKVDLRTPAYIAQQVDNFLVFCIEEDLVGYYKVIFYTDCSDTEIANLLVEKSYLNQEIGREMIHADSYNNSLWKL